MSNSELRYFHDKNYFPGNTNSQILPQEMYDTPCYHII